MLKPRLKPADRKADLVSVAIAEAEHTPYHQQTCATVADAAGFSRTLVSRYFGTATQLRRAVVRAAIRREHLLVVAQAIAVQDPNAGSDKISPDLRRRALASL